MDAVLAAQARRHGPLFAAIVLCAGFLVVHAVVFRPLADRYRGLIAEAAKLGLAVDPAHPATGQPLSVKLFTLLIDNSLSLSEAEARSQSGTLGAAMAQSLSSIAARHDLEILVAEPGQQTQQPGSIEVRAHLRLRGSYGSFVGLVEDLAHSDRLWAIERFTVLPDESGRDVFEVWVAGCLLTRSRGAS